MKLSIFQILVLLLTVAMLIVPVAVAGDRSTTVSLYVPPPPPPPPPSLEDVDSEILITATKAILDNGGYTVSGAANPTRISVDGNGGLYRICLASLPEDTIWILDITYNGVTDHIEEYDTNHFTVGLPQHTTPQSVSVMMDFRTSGNPPGGTTPGGTTPGGTTPGGTTPGGTTPGGTTPGGTTPGGTTPGGTTPGGTTPGGTTPGGTTPGGTTPGGTTPGGTTPGGTTPGGTTPGGTTPGGIGPDNPDIPDTPSDPEHPDTPGSDEPLVPILPPADSVYNFAGFIPLLAGFLLLFLLVAFRGNLVYRILKKHAKRHGEKPDKEEKKQLKATASAIILLIRDEERYGEWRKNREVEMRLSADIISVLDEMQYPPQIPRGAAAAEILKAAKGRINRHRL